MSHLVSTNFNKFPSVSTRIRVWELVPKMASRPRSQSRERVVVKTADFASGEALDPVKFLSDLIDGLNTLDVAISINLSDGTKKVSYQLSTFVRKQYEVRDGLVKFGFRSLRLDSLRATVSYEVCIMPLNATGINDDDQNTLTQF